MQVVIHPGVHKTDDDRLLKSLRKNSELFQASGVAVPTPSTYRRLIRDTLQAMENGPPAEDAAQLIFDAMLDDEQPERVLLSNENFFCVPKLAISSGILYPKAEQKIALFTELFDEADIELCLAIRDPASFLPAVFADAPTESFMDFMDGTDALDIRWSNLIWRIREAAPDIGITVWCNEDTPLIWGEVLREVAGVEPIVALDGSYDLLSEIMSQEGLKRFRSYMDAHPNMTEVQIRRVIAAFLDKFAMEDAIEEELDLPGWTEDYVDRISTQYEEDMFEIGRIPGVQMITP
ncbi:MAG: hypothetical protein FH759_05755 [Sediminimonas qiaohouensis]|uniref:Uncharacterized protein n=1 Tax=Sediminimonas qiaohouensis TaxID=552061 RepID=A0A7C9HBQ6_9RHOB|nr:hypothetical protein [Sediminimonas qiaohouensis]MTJ04187.1 hypothetical protein [Sediminimonas qiaohouensis]